LATESWQAWTLFLCYALFYGLTEPAEKTLVANLVGNDRKGLAYGWYNFAIGIATLPSSLIFGALYQFFGPMVAFGWGAVMAMLAGMLMLAVKEPTA
jgi:MFS family permease